MSLSLCLLLGGALVHAQDDRYEFKGAKLGITKQRFVEMFPYLECSKSTSPLLADEMCIGYHGKKECYKTPRGATVQESLDFMNACRSEDSRNYTYGGWIAISIYAYFCSDSLSLVTVTIHENGFSTVVAALTEKYGKPIESKTEVIETRAGVSYQNKIMLWRRADTYITATRYSDTIEESLISYKLSSFDAEFKKRQDESTRKNANDL